MIVEYYCGRPALEWEEGSKAPSQPKAHEGGVRAFLRRAFLPEGYPDSVSQDYTAFQLWDTVQALSSYVRGMLSSQAILRGVGVGQQAATPLGAVFQFFVRDVTGMMGGIMFAFSYGSSFDSCAKQWRLVADVVNDIGMAVELASPFFPGAFLAMACIGSMARAVSGVAGGATRAALTQHFARHNNAADIAAKEQSQEVATTMAGMALGVVFTSLFSGHLAACWSLFLLLTWLHVAANVRAMRCLVLTSLNGPRLDALLDAYLEQAARGGKEPPAARTPVQLAVCEDLTPPPLVTLVARAKRVWSGRQQGGVWRVVFGARFRDVVGSSKLDTRLQQLLQLPPSAPQADRPIGAVAAAAAADRPAGAATAAAAIATLSPRYLVAASGGARVVHVVVHQRAQSSDLLQAHVQARVLLRLLAGGALSGSPAPRGPLQVSTTSMPRTTSSHPSGTAKAGGTCDSSSGNASANTSGGVSSRAATESSPTDGRVPQAEEQAGRWMAERYEGFCGALRRAGWQTEHVRLPRPTWTATWGADELHKD